MRVPEDTRRREHLLIRGRLTRSDEFFPRRCGSTTFIHRWPEALQPAHRNGEVVAETVDADGRVLRTEMPNIVSEQVCAPIDSWRVRVYVDLDAEAVEVRLRRGDRVLWSTAIGEAPDVSVELASPPVRGEAKEGQGFPGGEPAVLTIDPTRAALEEASYVKVLYRWGERGFHVAWAGPAREKISIPADRLPGGERCEFFVIYSDGVRSAVAHTEPIEVRPIGPVITMVSPAEREKLTVGTPVELDCLVQHPEQPAEPGREPERTQWFVDGERVGFGTAASAGLLTEGEHRVEVRYTPVNGEEVRAARDVVVAPTAEPPAGEWPDHDPFADDRGGRFIEDDPQGGSSGT
ncbi:MULTISPECIES: hypothetical protein [unclassified Microbacterium]|uniref:hypothetical protein n=1 Tax=unclassified Microbacterium TaxID=2609290 RepID=UPI00214B98D3|nr:MULTISPECIES: hypothetical protein [unclassified Microbacterium]MCR2784174.1 hypothetical protein [Microbacterium sp. zg.B96]WIM14992.1 hypothetical protein QNO11_10565 [Microbacterium sp. zg-B96]